MRLSSRGQLRVERPDHLRAEVESDRKAREYFYDGKTFTIYAPKVGYYAQIAAADKTRLDIKGEHYFRDRPGGRDEVATAIADWIAPRRG